MDNLDIQQFNIVELVHKDALIWRQIQLLIFVFKDAQFSRCISGNQAQIYAVRSAHNNYLQITQQINVYKYALSSIME